MNSSLLKTTSIVLITVSCSIGISIGFASATKSKTDLYPYQSAAFSSFITDSSLETKTSESQAFYAWFGLAYLHHPKVHLEQISNLDLALEKRRQELLTINNVAQKSALEIKTASWLHGLVKALIPKFSLDRGFEFTNAMYLGERQCLLQSVLIAGLLQKMGVDAGTIMVWRSQSGEDSNNGHVVTLMKNASGQDLIIDASDKEPVMRHKGLFVYDSSLQDYRFVHPQFAANGSILGYKRVADGRLLQPAQVEGLRVSYLRSQFYYYRGERVKDGFLGTPSTTSGLKTSARLLETAQHLAPQNALAVYVLGHVYRRLGQLTLARTQYSKGYTIYKTQGFVPLEPGLAYKRWVQLP